MKKKTILTVLLAAAAVLSLSVAALADFTQTITLTAAAETLTVEVPTRLNILLSPDGNGKMAGTGTATITNYSKLGVTVKGTISELPSDVTVTPSVTSPATASGNTVTLPIGADDSADNSGKTGDVTYNVSCAVGNAWVASQSAITVTYTVEFS